MFGFHDSGNEVAISVKCLVVVVERGCCYHGDNASSGNAVRICVASAVWDQSHDMRIFVQAWCRRCLAKVSH